MKKRIQTLMFLTLMAFLFSGLTSLSAQSLTAGPATLWGGANGKTVVEFQNNTDATTIVETELLTNFGTTQPADPTDLASAELYYQAEYLRTVISRLNAGDETHQAVFAGYDDVVEISKVNWPTLDTETWRDDMVSLLSN